MERLQHKLAGDSDPAWAAWGMMRLTAPMVEALVQAAREEEDRALSEVRKSRSDSFHKWAAADTKGSLKAAGSEKARACLASTGFSPWKMGRCLLGRPALSKLSMRLGGRSGNRALTAGPGRPDFGRRADASSHCCHAALGL